MFLIPHQLLIGYGPHALKAETDYHTHIAYLLLVFFNPLFTHIEAMLTSTTSESPTLPEKNCLDLTKLTDDGRTNNYAEFKYKAMLKMKAYNHWRYIEGPESVPPAIPDLRKARKVKGKDDNGNDVTITIPGNEVEVEEAMK